MWIPVFPDDFLRCSFDLNDARVGGALAVTKGPVVEDEDGAVVKLAGAVLLCYNCGIQMPDYFACGA